MDPRVPQEVASILNEIQKAIDAKLYYLAIAVALSVPDICACLEFDPDNPRRANMQTYATWCGANMVGRFKNLTGVDLYRLRCGVLHFGHFQHPKSVFDRIMFIGPESNIKAHDVIATVNAGVSFGGISAASMNLEGRILQLGVLEFCRAIMDAASTWAIAKSSDPFVSRNLPRLVRYRPDGLPPFSVGVPTVA